jgi:hypothetical protein
VLPRRWLVERTIAWISKHRRCVRDYERLPAHHEAMVTWAMVVVMTGVLLARIDHHPSRPTLHDGPQTLIELRVWVLPRAA